MGAICKVTLEGPWGKMYGLRPGRVKCEIQRYACPRTLAARDIETSPELHRGFLGDIQPGLVWAVGVIKDREVPLQQVAAMSCSQEALLQHTATTADTFLAVSKAPRQSLLGTLESGLVWGMGK